MNNGSIIEVRSLHKVYTMGKVEVPALRGIDLHVDPGDFLSIVGPSGSGKSTLFHIIGGLTSPTSGTVRVAGHDLMSLSESGRTDLRRRSVGFVFQRFNLLPNLTARDNIAVARHIAGMPQKPDPQFEDLLRFLGIAHRLDHKPNALSGGEQQRVAIARAVVNHPAILLADEPTGNLDTEHSQAVLELLKNLNEQFGQTVLMITHNSEAAEYGHHTVHMRDGRVVERISRVQKTR
ncbi:MAG TPA: ABC transporter ATP-binding protein [Bryobacteraceae bacterium]